MRQLRFFLLPIKGICINENFKKLNTSMYINIIRVSLLETPHHRSWSVKLSIQVINATISFCFFFLVENDKLVMLEKNKIKERQYWKDPFLGSRINVKQKCLELVVIILHHRQRERAEQCEKHKI